MTHLVLALALAAADGDPEPRRLALSLARAVRTGDAVSFDLRAEWPPGVQVAAPDQCTPTLTLPDGSTPKLVSKVTSTAARSFVTHLEYTAKEAAGPSPSTASALSASRSSRSSACRVIELRR
jgi:hypothetical protein